MQGSGACWPGPQGLAAAAAEMLKTWLAGSQPVRVAGSGACGPGLQGAWGPGPQGLGPGPPGAWGLFPTTPPPTIPLLLPNCVLFLRIVEGISRFTSFMPLEVPMRSPAQPL